MLSSIVWGQQRVSGIVRDAESGERLIGASIYDGSVKSGTVTDHAGYFSWIAAPGRILEISYVGYQTQRLVLERGGDTLLKIALKPVSMNLGMVQVTATHVRPTFNVAKLSTEEIANIYSITGKPDVLKALQMLPGLRSQGEMSSVTLVRGGNPGENLYLLDNTPLIYVHHIGGYMSVFNPDMIQDVEIYKGGFPAKYGERLSSILNISQKEGDKSGFQGSFSVGVSDVSLTLQGPTPLKNSSFIVTARKTLVDLYFLAVSAGTNDALLWYGFHDLNAKFSWSPDERNSFSFNLYQGDDYLQQLNKPKRETYRKGTIWGNTLVSANWTHIFPSNVLWKNTLSYTYYRLRESLLMRNSPSEESVGSEIRQRRRSSVQDLSWRSDGQYQVNSYWNLGFGGKVSHLRFRPMTFSYSENALFDIDNQTDAMESSVYLSNQVKATKWLQADLGLRFVSYVHSDFSHLSLEPRLSLTVFPDGKHQFQVAATRMSQNAQMLYNVGSLTANEIFIPSGDDVPVSFSNQFTVGYRGVFFESQYRVEADLFYKTMDRLSTYKEGFQYTLGDAYWKENLLSGGRGESYGLELMVKKVRGRLTGFVGYSYARSTRCYAEINEGRSFSFDYDSPHAISLNVAYQISPKWTFSATWQYQTGLPYTPAIGRYNQMVINDEGLYELKEVILYGDKNSARMRDYHRLDVCFRYTKYSKRRHRKIEWTFGVSNLYSRQNPYFYYYSYNGLNEPVGDGGGSLKPYQMSMFPLIPMVSFKMWFGSNSEQKARQRKARVSVSKWLGD